MKYFQAKKMARGGIVGGDYARAEGTRRSGEVMFARGGEIPEPRGEEMEPPNMLDRREHVCPECGAGFAFGGELPEPSGEEMEPKTEKGGYMGGYAKGGEVKDEHVFCPSCGHRFSAGGEIPEPAGEEMEPPNMSAIHNAGPFSHAVSQIRSSRK